MLQTGTHFFEPQTLQAALPPTPPPVAHDAPTQPGIRRPSPAAITIAKIRFFFLACSPIERAAALGVASIWCLALLVLLLIAGILSYDLFLANKDLSPTPRSTLPALLLTPLVHVGIEPLFTATPAIPAMQPRATPAATRRPPVIIVVPTPAK
jgi:hypothetical protein